MSMPSDKITEAARAISRQLVNSDLGRIMKIAPTLIYVFDHVENANVYSNYELGEMLGYSESELQKMGADLMSMLTHPDDLGAIFAHFRRIANLADGETISIEYRAKHRKGHWVWLFSRDTVFLRGPDGEVVQHIGAAVDISPQKRAEGEARVAEKRNRATNDELREFAYSISHDIKAPSNTLELILSELEEEAGFAPESDEAELLDMAHETLSNMQYLIENVLKYTRVVDQEMTVVTVDLNAVLSTLMTVQKAEIQETNATLKVSDLPKVKGSHAQLTILFQNLLQNAMKFTAEGVKPVIEIMTTPKDARGQVVITVRDNGIGIAPDKHDQVFQLFKRLNSNMQYPGTGIGLAACRRIATNHQSQILIDSEPSKGAAFSIALDAA